MPAGTSPTLSPQSLPQPPTERLAPCPDVGPPGVSTPKDSKYGVLEDTSCSTAEDPAPPERGCESGYTSDGRPKNPDAGVYVTRCLTHDRPLQTCYMEKAKDERIAVLENRLAQLYEAHGCYVTDHDWIHPDPEFLEKARASAALPKREAGG